MIRSGSTLQFQIAADLVERYKLGKRIEYVEEKEFPVVLERHRNESGFKVFKAHICTPAIQELFHQQQAKGICSYRDLRDVAVSAMKKFEITFEKLIEDNWLDYATGQFDLWARLPNVMVSRYEQMFANIPEEVMREAQHLGIKMSSGEAQEIAAQFSLEKQRERVKQVALARQAGVSPYDQNSLLHHNHVNRPEPGGWRTVLSSAQVEIIERRYGHWFDKMGYPRAVRWNSLSVLFSRLKRHLARGSPKKSSQPLFGPGKV